MIKSIKISNYKNLDGFEFDGFGRLNLITGKNNVGKTNLLEAMFLGLNSKDELGFIINSRQSKGDIYNTKSIENLFTNLNLNKNISIILNNKPTFELKFEKYISTFSNDNFNSNYILSNQQLSGKNLSESFTEIIKQNKKTNLLKVLQIIDSKIIDIQILVDGSNVNIYLTKEELTLPISFFGDAIQKIFIIFSKFFLKKQTILIDEIENGIYYENQKEFWSKLLEISKLTNCQIIATTHSLEMINSFYEITKDEEDCKLLKLVRNIDNEILMREMEKDLIEYELEDKNLNNKDVLR